MKQAVLIHRDILATEIFFYSSFFGDCLDRGVVSGLRLAGFVHHPDNPYYWGFLLAWKGGSPRDSGCFF